MKTNYCYIHIPFCESKCRYCKFASWSHLGDVKKQIYVDYLCAQIKNYPQQKKLSGLYFGGGTPSSLSDTQLERIFSILRERFSFSKNCEITLETTPQNISKQRLGFWKELGINRISTGVQSLNEKTLDEIGRLKKTTILSSLELLFSASIKNISTDWIIGLPHTKYGETKSNIEHILKKFPQMKHISVYMLEDYYYGDAWQNLTLSPEEIAKEYISIVKLLEKYGFVRYEVSNFAKPGFACKHNQAYWQHKQLIAFGLDAHGYEDSIRYAYPNSFSQYYSGEYAYTEKIDSQKKRLETVMFGLRTTGVSQKYISKETQEKLLPLIKQGYLQFQNHTYSISNKGIPVIDTILAQMI